MGTDQTREQEHFFGAARMVAGLTLLSRVLGLLRDMVLVPLGGPAAGDAFWIAFSIPNMFRRLFGEGALAAAFVPVFTETGEQSGWARARAVLANTAGLLAVVLVGLTLLIEAGVLVALHHSAGKWPLRLELTMLMLPYMVGVCLLALCSAALNSKGHFAYPAAAPVLLNVALIVVGYWLAPALGGTARQQFYIIGTALVLCSLGQLAGAVWLLRRSGMLAWWTLRPVLPEVRAIARRMAPTVLPLSLMQFSVLLGRFIAMIFTSPTGSPQPALPLLDGVVRCHYAASRLYQLPMGVLGISLATAVFPLLSRCVARGDQDSLRSVLNRALRLCLFLGIPAGAGLILLAGPIVGAIFQRRGFSAFDTERAAAMLRMYCLGMPAYFCMHILLRTFFARKEVREPMILSAVLAGAYVAIVIGGIFTPGVRSAVLGLATTLTASANAAVLAWILHRRLGRLGWRSIAASVVRVALATAAMAAAVLAVRWGLEAAGAGRLAVVVAGVGAGAGVFAAAAFALRCPELAELARLRSKPPDHPV